MEDQEKLRRIQGLAQEIVETLLQEAFFNEQPHLRNSVEHLANTVAALTKIQLQEDQNREDTLRYTVSKMKIAKNAIDQEKHTRNIKNLA